MVFWFILLWVCCVMILFEYWFDVVLVCLLCLSCYFVGLRWLLGYSRVYAAYVVFNYLVSFGFAVIYMVICLFSVCALWCLLLYLFVMNYCFGFALCGLSLVE